MAIEIKNKKAKNHKVDWNLVLKKDIIPTSKLNDKRKEQIYAELTILLKSGISLSRALGILKSGLSKNIEIELFDSVYKSIVSGNSFFKALENENIFSDYEIQLIKIGEETGNLYPILQDLSLYYKDKSERKRKLIGTLTYPCIVLVTSILVVYFMLLYVVPMFEDIFKQNGIELPFITQIILSISHFIQGNFSVLILLFLGAVLFFLILRKQSNVKNFFSYLYSKVPVIGAFIVKVNLIRFLQIMNLLTRSKFTLLSGIKMAKQVILFAPLKDTLEIIEKDILRGESLSASLKKFEIYDAKMISLIQVAEETNQTEYIFEKLYEQYTKDLEYASQNLNNLLNPLITVFIGLVVGFVLIAMYMPMFELSSVIS